MNKTLKVSLNTNFIGGSLSIVASVLCNVGIVMQKRSHSRKNGKDDKTLNYASSTWRLGIVLQTLGGILDFEALTYATQELVALVGGSSTVLIGAVCSFLIEDDVAPRLTDLFGISVLLVAVVCAAYGSPAEHTFYTVEDLEMNFFKPNFIRYAIAVSVLTAALLVYAAYVLSFFFFLFFLQKKFKFNNNNNKPQVQCKATIFYHRYHNMPKQK